MDQQVKIEHLKNSDTPEVIELFIQAFKDYPFIPALIPAFQTKPELEKMFLKAIFDLYIGIKDSMLYGIREKGRLICASLSVNSMKNPSILSLIRFIFFMIRFNIFISSTLGRHKAKEIGDFFEKVFHKEKPKYKEPYLELVLFGTLPEYQRQGFGRKMLHFLYEEAKNRGYKGVMLITNRDIPAFRLYLKEGFIVEKEFTIYDTTLSWMRLVFECNTKEKIKNFII